jgi:hypothetical protein
MDRKIIRKLTLCYETFPEEGLSVLSVGDEETDTCIFMTKNEEADRLYKYLTQNEKALAEMGQSKV